jgi:predicted branched-subunit amino acid permease
MTKQITGYHAVVRKALVDSISMPAFILLTSMMGFGSLASQSGFDTGMASFASVFIWGLPGQLAMVELTAAGHNLFSIVLACSLANARFMPMVLSFLPHLFNKPESLPKRLLYAQLLSVNSWAVSLRAFPYVDMEWRRVYYLTFASSIILAAVIGTMLGVYISNEFPTSVVLGLVFLSPLFFALVLSSTKGLSYRLSLLSGCLVIPAAHYFFPQVDLLIAGVIGGTLGFTLARLPLLKNKFS